MDGGSGGDSSGKMSEQEGRDFAEEYVSLHNAASKEYKTAFKEIGARMWNHDDMHPLKKENEEFIAEVASGRTTEDVKKLYGFATRPLTVLDSFPEIRKDAALMKRFNAKIDKIQDSHQKKLDAIWEKYSGNG